MPIFTARRTPALLAAALVTLASAVAKLDAQEPRPEPEPPAADPGPYRAPSIALVHPSGGAVPQDRPAVVLRFAQGEPGDPLDLTSFAVWVDSCDRTALFRVASSEAWGPLAPAAVPGEPVKLRLGVHQVVARICSTRGACSTISVPVEVTALHPGAGTSPPGPRVRRRWLFALLMLLDALERLFGR